MKKFVSIFLAACAISSMSITAFAQQASAINVTSDEQIKLSFGEEKFDELLLPGESYTYPLYIEGDDGTLAPLTDDHLEELRLRTEVRDENSSIASFKLEEKDNAYQLAVTTEAGWPTEQDEVEGVIKAVRRSNGKEAGSVSVDLTVGYPTISDESLEGAQNGEYVFVESSAPVITTEQFAKLDEYTDSGKVTFTNGMWSYEVRVSGQESVNMLYNERAIREISSKFEDQDFLYVSFPGGPAFDFTGTLSIDVSEVDDAFEGQFYVYRYLRGEQLALEAKGIAVGVRLEHPSQVIDCIQYHTKYGRGRYLPAAAYSFVTQSGGRGVYSFCMCPGGFVVPAASGPQQIVVNGMSPSTRGSAWSNAGMVVETRPEDLDGELSSFMREAMQDEAFAESRAATWADRSDPLRLMVFQEALERACWTQGNHRQTAPAQRMTDFVNGRLSYDLPTSSYSPGLIASPLHFWMPRFVTARLQEAFVTFGQRSRGFLSKEATVIAVETRTSAPVRIVRRPDDLQHPGAEGLFPCGEGAGYAGGIVSAALDGERCAEAAAAYLGQ